MDYTDRESVKDFIKENDIRDLAQLDTFLKQITGVVLEEMLEAERDDYLGYSRYDSSSKKTENSRNGYSPKTVRSSHGEIKLDIPRDRDGDFEPELIKKYQRDIVHVMRNSLKYVSHDDMQEFSRDAKPIYKAPTEEAALLALDGRGGVRNIRLQ